MRPEYGLLTLQLFSAMEVWSEAEGGVPLLSVYTSLGVTQLCGPSPATMFPAVDQ
jgi:hypothetical protein